MSSSLMTVYLKDAQDVIFTCPKCGEPQFVPGDEKDSQVVKCRCAQQVTLVRNTRQATRYPTRLHGTYSHVSASAVESMLIISLSRSGLSFRTLLAHDLHLHDRLEIGFILDNTQHTSIMLKASVRWIEQRAVGAMFEPDHEQTVLLDTYLRNWASESKQAEPLQETHEA